MFVLAFVAASATSLHAQGAFNLSNQPPNSGGNSAGVGAGGSFDVICSGTTPIRIYRVGCAVTGAGTYDVEVRYRLGGFSTVYPTTAAANLALTGWTLAGSATTTFAAALTPTQVPLNLNLQVPVGQRMGISVRVTTGTLSYQSVTVGIQVANNDITMMYGGITGLAGNSGVDGPGQAASFHPRGAIATVWYDYDQFTGSHLSVQAAQVNSGAGLQIGANTVQAVLRNMGTIALDATPIAAEYSTDGGTTWVGAQTFSFPSFPVLSNQTATFTLPWGVPVSGNRTLSVRLIAPSPIGQGEAQKSVSFSPDLDVDVVSISPTIPALNAPVTVSATVKNNGSFNFNGQTLSMRYSINGGTPVIQPFVPATLATTNATEVVTFTTTHTFTLAGNYTLAVAMDPQVTGDPDTTDSKVLQLDNVGVPFVAYAPTAGLSGSLGQPIYRSSSTATAGSTSVYQMIYSATDLTGLPTGAMLNNIAFFKANDHRSSTGKTAALRVWMQNTTLTAFTGSATYADFATGSTMVYQNLAWSIPAATGWLNFGPFNQPTPFVYSGGGIIVSVEWNTTGLAAPVTEPGPSANTALQWQYEAYTITNTGRAFSITTPTTTTSVSLNGLSSSTQRAHARFFYDSPTTPIITNFSVPNAFQGVAYSNTFNAIGGASGPYVWTIASGALPNGLTLSASTGVISGTPATGTASATAYSFVLSCTDTSGTTQKSFTILVTPLTITTAAGALPNSNAGFPYSGGITAIGGTGTFVYTVSAGTLPSGLSLNPTTGAITGVSPSSAVSTTPVAFTIQVADGATTVTRSFTILVVTPSFELLTAAAETTGGVSSGYPFNTGWHDQRLESIYLASELVAAGVYGGAQLTGLQLKVGGIPGMVVDNFRIRVQHTTATVHSGTYTTTGWTLLYGPVNMPVTTFTVGNWLNFQFSAPFTWNGTDNLMFDFTTDGSNYVGAGGVFVRTTPVVRSLYGYADSAGVWPFDTGMLGPYQASNVPSLKLEFPAPNPTDLDIDGVSFGTPSVSGPSLGNNTINVTIRSVGLQAFTSPFNLEYSANNGPWIPNAPFTPTTLTGSGTTQVFSFTTPWAVSSPLAPQNLRVRINPVVTGDPDVTDEVNLNYNIDADITGVRVQSGPFVGNNNVIVSVKNSGTMSLNGATILLQYSTDNGTSFGNAEPFVPTTLGGVNATQDYTFLVPWNLTAIANYTLVARIATALPGDPDTVDSASMVYQDAGGAFEVLSTAPQASSGGGTVAGFPFNTYWHDMRMEAIYLASELTTTGLYPSSQITAIQLKVSQLPGRDLENVRIRMQHTTASVHSGSYATSGYTDCYGPTLLSLTAVPPVMTVDQWTTFTFTTPFVWNGTDNLLVDITHDNTAYVSGGGCYMRSTPGTVNRHLKGYSDSNYTWPFDGMTNGGMAASVPSMRFQFPAPSNPGVAVSRSGNNINDASTDNLGNAIYATLLQTRSWSILNYGASINLNVSAVNITNQSNVLATVTTSPVGTPILPLGTGTLTLTVAPQAGPYSFDVELVTNSATASQQSFTWTVTGVGFVNSIPQIQVIGNSDIQVSGVHPNYLVEMVSQTNMNFEIRAVDPDTAQTVNLTVATATGGTLTAAQAGFTTTFPVSATAGVSPRVITMAGTAGSPGTTNLVANSSDDGTIAANDMINIQVKIGARLDIMTTTVASQFVRVNGRKDFYRGQTAQPVSLTVTNANPFAIQLNAVTFKTVTTGNVAITGFTFTIQNGPVTIPANTTAMPVSVLMDIAANASGINGAPITFNSASGVAVDPVTATNIVIVKVLSADSEFDLYDGPVPMPFQITSTTLGPAVQTVPYLQNLNATGGNGSYTWSIAASSQFGLPSGLTLNPQGSAFLPASISGQPTTTATPGTYAITFECTDGAYVDTEVLSITVSILTPLTFPPVSLANGQEFVAYSMTAPFAATGGSLIYTFSVSSSSNDQLPTGLSLNSVTGVISGIPANGTQGSYNITFEVSDGVSSLTQTAQLTIVQLPLQWRGTTVPTAVQTVSYSEALDAIGGTGPRIYSIVSGTLPNGLSLSAATGVISGIPSLTPNSIGTYNMVFKVTDGLNVSVNQAITITVVAAPPLVVTTSVLDYGMVGMTYAASIGVTGGSQNYVISVASSSGAQVPAGLALAPNGDITGTPAIGSDGRYALELSVNDGFQTITRTVILPVLAGGARGVAITEVDAATGYVELTNSEDALVDVSGWSITVWVDSNTPVSLPFDSIPGASLALPAEVVTITLGGTAGGFWPTYATGGTWTGTSTSNISVLLSDIHGNTIDFVSFGSANRASLVDAANAAIDLPTPLDTMANANSGAANYSYDGMAWVGSPTGTPGIYNAGLATFPLAIIKDNVRTANSGQAYSDFTFAIGGRAPYTFTLTAPAATWLSLSTGGVFSGTAPTVTTDTTVSVDVTVTDTLSVAVTETFEIRIAPASTTPSATFTVGNAEGQSFEGTVIDVPVTMTRANGVTDVMGFGFVIELAAATALELDVVRVLPGPATIAAGSSLVARDLGNNRIFVGDYSSPTAAPSNFADGVVAIVRFMVPVDNNVMAPEATYAVNIADVEIGRTATGVHTAAGANGSMILSNYKPQDVNRDNAIDVVDVQQTVNIILSLFTPTYAGQGDANSDNAVDVVDVQTIVNCILLGGC